MNFYLSSIAFISTVCIIGICLMTSMLITVYTHKKKRVSFIVELDEQTSRYPPCRTLLCNHEEYLARSSNTSNLNPSF